MHYRDSKADEPELKRKMATIERTIVQKTEIPIEQYEQLYGNREVETHEEELPAHMARSGADDY